MYHTLVVGCSYVEMLSPFPHNNPNHHIHHSDRKLFDTIDHDNFLIVGRAGSGNPGIAARVMYECSKHRFDQVIVLWSGINRLDFPIPMNLQKTFPRVNQNEWAYDYITELENVVWYHSGGLGASGCQENCPKFIRKFFQNQYKGATPKYLTDLSLQSVISTQSFLKVNNIDYKMGWLYDINAKTNNTHLGSGCGDLDNTSRYVDLMDWSKINKITAYEWSRDNNLLSDDRYHWTRDGAVKWFDQILGVKLTKTLDQ